MLSPGAVRDVRRAVVFKGDVPAAELIRERAGVRFRYLPDYQGRAVATTLPVGEAVVSTGGALPPFFSGLLPEGRRLTALRTAVKTSADDELSLLLAVGTDLIGDVRVLADGEDPDDTARPALDAAGDLDFTALLAGEGMIDRVGLPGVQEKASGAMISLPVHLAGISAIVKLDPPEYPNVVVNEHYFLGLARRAGLNVVNAELVHDIHGRPGLVVERFDRARTSGDPSRLAVEDACQLLGRYPADKYRLASEEVVGAARRVASAASLAARDVFMQFVFAWLTGNGDAHAKNVSMVQTPTGEWRVAPAYDLPSTLPYGDHELALPLGGRRAGLIRRHVEEFGAAVGLNERTVSRSIERVLDGTAPMFDDFQQGALPLNRNALQTLTRQLRRRRDDMAR